MVTTVCVLYEEGFYGFEVALLHYHEEQQRFRG
jgi:hypothetical protein